MELGRIPPSPFSVRTNVQVRLGPRLGLTCTGAFGARFIPFGVWARIFLWLGIALFMAAVDPVWGGLIFCATLIYNLAIFRSLRKRLATQPIRHRFDDPDDATHDPGGQGGIGRPVLPIKPPLSRGGGAACVIPDELS